MIASPRLNRSAENWSGRGMPLWPVRLLSGSSAKWRCHGSGFERNSTSATLKTSLCRTRRSSRNSFLRTPLWRHAKNKSMNTPTNSEALPLTACSASSCGNLWIIQIGDSVEVVRRKLLTATEPPLTRDEALVGALCQKIIQQNDQGDSRAESPSMRRFVRRGRITPKPNVRKNE